MKKMDFDSLEFQDILNSMLVAQLDLQVVGGRLPSALYEEIRKGMAAEFLAGTGWSDDEIDAELDKRF